jgi:oligopeptide transport system permease protein
MSENEKNTVVENEDELFHFVPYSAEKAESIGYSNYSYWGSVFRNFLKKKFTVGLAIAFILLFIFTFVALAIGKFDVNNLRTEPDLYFQTPNSTYWFGCDNLGRDYWCQVWYASRISIELAAVVAVGEMILGVAIGLLWGYVRSLDRFFTELYNLIDNVPRIIYLTLISLMIGQSFWIMAAAMIGFGWLAMARNVRNLCMMYRDREYNLASRCLGTPLFRILTKNILPYLVSVIILRLALSIPNTIALESTLSYLGLGLDVNTPSLGLLLRNARTYFLDYPYLLVFPAVIVSIITVTFYLVGNAFSDAADPRNHV